MLRWLMVFVLAGCDCGSGESTVDSGPAMRVDSSLDAGSMQDSASEPDAPMSMDSGPVEDAAVDADVLPDAGADAGQDAGSDAGMDSGADACMPLVPNLASADSDCTQTPDSCPAGYTCHAFNGFVLQLSCQVLCEEDCDCPGASECVTVTDKLQTWQQCAQPT